MKTTTTKTVFRNFAKLASDFKTRLQNLVGVSQNAKGVVVSAKYKCTNCENEFVATWRLEISEDGTVTVDELPF